jgi:hypothetical protein
MLWKRIFVLLALCARLNETSGSARKAIAAVIGNRVSLENRPKLDDDSSM